MLRKMRRTLDRLPRDHGREARAGTGAGAAAGDIRAGMAVAPHVCGRDLYVCGGGTGAGTFEEATAEAERSHAFSSATRGLQGAVDAIHDILDALRYELEEEEEKQQHFTQDLS
eukprot:TRINITY_DN4497_c0_g1_i1.p1 TRINITY_DN4497_c0_g1~~TRINITY_DN4497_c0_g1_i1.p1  ORF type:complete len:114 (-),score=39.31 TRINITY_DN4497_c0_g1_i1:192-533(-)